jgi:hypothetical protein
MTSALIPDSHIKVTELLCNRQPTINVRHPCYCSTYSFPHRPGSGKCVVTRQTTRYFTTGAVVRACESLCSSCGQPSDTYEEDVGIGPYEFWGAVGCDVRYESFTNCCDGHLVDNTMANKARYKWLPESVRTT